MKGVINSFDMDSGLEAWRKKKEADKSKSLKGYKIPIGREFFSLEAYRDTQTQSTAWMAKGSERMVEFLQSKVEKDTRAWKRASLTAKSYLLQEAESTSRLAKMDWCKGEGIRVTSLQHDGIMIEVDEGRYEEARKGMSRSATRACGYEVEVVVKGISAAETQVEEAVEEEGCEDWDLGPLRSTHAAEGGGGKERRTTNRWDESEDDDMNTLLQNAWAEEAPGHMTPPTLQSTLLTLPAELEEADPVTLPETAIEAKMRKWAESVGLSHTYRRN